jgi:mono/diheme cytochrome c family protein
MSKILRLPGLTRFFLVTLVGLIPVGLTLFSSARCFGQAYGGQDPGIPEIPMIDPFGQFPGNDGTMPRRTIRSKAARKKTKAAEKGSAKKTDGSAKNKTTATKAGAGDNGPLKFSQDIAPIIVANCTGCHSKDGEGLRRGKLDLTTFDKLQKGTDHKIIVPGRPDQSHLIMRLKGTEKPRMPKGANRVISDEAIAKIEQWVKEGAKLDAGVDAKKTIESYAASPEQMRRSQLAKVPVQERNKAITATGLERWKKANPKLKPEIVQGDHFVMFSNLPRDRAGNTLKVMEGQYGHLKRLLATPSMDWVENVSLYVFASRNDFIEFVRAVESREPDTDARSSARFAVPQPYLAVVDPSGGKKDEPAAGKRRGRSKRGGGGDADGGEERTLAGVLTEALGTACVAGSGTPPHWLAFGIGSYMASHVEASRSSYYQQLRQTAFTNYDQGWKTKATEALGGGDGITADALHAIGFALVEAMMSEMSQGFSQFVYGMLQGGEKLDEMLEKVYGGSRDEFIEGTGDWIAARYRGLQ